ncbi:MFS general substrate transporter [Fistulina hepatica ATCC 64428]|uniref:MFS general substrate transporter n=1 Tax=Fistulina hepatica ATCC 64428 TaxID=1128425 RepID=A0A0D7AN58_9AGAR|nr:MFS general substrate transporter [Fistulina hepatica ATCC 64428]
MSQTIELTAIETHVSVKSETRVLDEAADVGRRLSDPTPTLPPPDAFDSVPDGGYGWVIVAACSMIMFFSVGGTYSWGVIQARLAAENLAKNSTLAFIGSLSTSFVALGAIANGHVIRLLGTRNAAILGCFLLGFGQILSSFCTKSVPALFITYGLIDGLGTSLTFISCATLPAQYFKRKRGLANGLVYGGAGLGGATLSVSLDALSQSLGLPWAFRVVGFSVLLLTIPAACMLKDRSRRAFPTVEWTLFRDPKFTCLALGSAIATFPLLVPPFFIPLYAASLGMSTTVSSVLLAIFNIASGLGRVGFGFLCDYTGPITSLALSLVVSALSILAIWPASTSLPPLVVFIFLTGLGNGGFFSTVPSVVSHVYGPHRVTTVLAMVLTAWMFGYMLGSPIAGWILQMYGGSDAGIAAYRPAMYYAGSLSLGAAGFILAVRYLVSQNLFSFA